jgi:hypothetical protein
MQKKKGKLKQFNEYRVKNRVLTFIIWEKEPCTRVIPAGLNARA